MILDSSAILAILFAEPDAPRYAEAIERAATRRLSAATWLESAIRIDMTASPVASMDFDAFIRESRVSIEPVDEAQVHLARAAYRAYGRGSGHPAGLNFGDCFSYALAKIHAEPLLYKGDDFSRTDLVAAVPSGADAR